MIIMIVFFFFWQSGTERSLEIKGGGSLETVGFAHIKQLQPLHFHTPYLVLNACLQIEVDDAKGFGP